MSYNIAVVGATGKVGGEMIRILEERNFPVNKIHVLASRRSLGKEISFKDKTLKAEVLEDFDFNGIDFVFSSPGANISKIFSPKAAKAGAIVIDNTSYFRTDPEIPLVVPEVNPDDLKYLDNKNIVANPNCSTIQMVVALKPLHDLAKIKRVVASTYQAVSGSGKEAMDELFNQTKGIFFNKKIKNNVYPKRIAFNCIPQIDVFMEDGSTKEEWKMNVETKKMLDKNIEVSATAVRVPIFIGHAISLNVEFENEFTLENVMKVLNDAPGVKVIDERKDGGYATHVECPGIDSVFVSRVRIDKTKKNTLSLYCVADNLRKGAALNTIQIAEKIIEMGLK